LNAISFPILPKPHLLAGFPVGGVGGDIVVYALFESVGG